MNDMSKNARLLPPGDVEDAVLASPKLSDYLRPPKVWIVSTIAVGTVAAGLGLVVWLGGSDERTLSRIDEMQRQVALLQAQNNASSANAASIQSQLAGLQTQLVVLQNQMFQLQSGSPLMPAAQSAPAPALSAFPAQGAGAPYSQSGSSPRVTPAARPKIDPKTASAADLSALINDGLRGKDRANDPVYQQIMYSALDLGSAYRVSLATWGPDPSPLAAILEKAPIASFAFKPTANREAVLVLPKTDELRETLQGSGIEEVTVAGQKGFIYD